MQSRFITNAGMTRIIKTVKGRQYVYEQTSYRVGKRVRTKSKYLGPIGRVTRAIAGFIEANRSNGPRFDETWLTHYNNHIEKEKAALMAAMEVMHEKYGMKLSEDKPSGQLQGHVVSEVHPDVTREASVGQSQGDQDAAGHGASGGESNADS